MDLKHIRNFSIIAHIDHGKSTLADRLLEVTNTIEKRKMHDRVLDDMELEKEKGITIKMRPVRMEYQGYILNLIDTPGHIDFSYEVSRAIKAVEGSILLVDSTQGVQAQTLTTLGMARESGLTIIPVLTKIDSPLARVPEATEELAELLGSSEDDVILTSGKTGEGVEKLLQELIKRVPPPESPSDSPVGGGGNDSRSLIFDFQYSNHTGVIIFARVMDGTVAKGDALIFKASGERFTALEVGVFTPDASPRESLSAGEIGYIVTGIKRPGIASVGDTVSGIRSRLPALPGYMTPSPVVWASIYPESQDDFEMLKQALGKLRLSDSSFTYEEESSGTLGRGFRCGFLGLLHLEIITERLKREFNLTLVVATPSITYEVEYRNGKKATIYSPALFPEQHEIVSVQEPLVKVKVITPSEYISPIIQLLFDHEGEVIETKTKHDNRSELTIRMPLRELMRNFFDEIKSVSSGFASLSYEFDGSRKADVTRLDILVAEEIVPAFSRVVATRRIEIEAEKAAENLYKVLPRQMFATKIWAKGLGRIISSRTLPAMQKNVTQHMYGGDRTRKMKLWKKQKEGKKRMKAEGTVNIPHDVFIKMMKGE